MVEHLIKVKDSYNCDMLSQVAGVAALRDQDYLAETRSRILATRSRLTGALRALGYTVPDSQSNFVWATGGPPARETFQKLKDRKILVRLMTYPGLSRRAEDHDRHRRRDRPAARVARPDELSRPSSVSCTIIAVINSCLLPARPTHDLEVDFHRTVAEIVRKTRETDIRLRLDLDGEGRAEVATGIGFLDHMLELFARHSLMDLTVACTGDLHVDGHHTTEDVGICLGQAIDRALGDRAGIRRYGHAVLPMDETLVTTAVDLGGRAYWVWNVAMPAPKIGDLRQRAGRRFLAGGLHAGADEPAREPSLRPEHPPHQRGDLQGGGPRPSRRVRARSPLHRRSLDQGHALNEPGSSIAPATFANSGSIALS